MIKYALTIYGLSVLLNWKRPQVAFIAAAFFMLEITHEMLALKYFAAQFLSLAALTLIPIYVSRFAPLEVRRPMQESAFVLIVLYFVAWVTVESGNDNANFFYLHLLILLYQFWTMNRGCPVLADLFERHAWVHRHHAQSTEPDH